MRAHATLHILHVDGVHGLAPHLAQQRLVPCHVDTEQMLARLVGRSLMPDRPLTAARGVDALALLIELLAERACVVVLLPADHVPACAWEGRVGAGR